MKRILSLSVVALIFMRNDFWFWQDTFLFLGIVPIVLVHQITISMLAALLWWFAVHYCWPSDLEEVNADEQQMISRRAR